MKNGIFFLILINGLLFSQSYESRLFEKSPNPFYHQQLLVADDYYFVIGNSPQYDNTNVNLTLVKFDLDGQIISEFGDSGIKNHQITESYSHLDSYLEHDTVTVLVSEKYLNFPQVLMIKIDPEGNLLPDFGDEGKKNIFPMLELTNIHSVNKIDDGFVFLTERDSANMHLLEVSKTDLYGNRDSSFGNNGFLRLEQPFLTIGYFEILKDTNRLYIIGEDSTVDYKLIVVGITRDGEFDTSFSADGTLISTWNDDRMFHINIAHISNNYLYLTVLREHNIGWQEHAVVKLNFKGNLVTDFGIEGAMSVNQPFAFSNFSFNETSDENFFLLYNNNYEQPVRLEIIKFDKNGIKDVNFDDGGYLILQDGYRDELLYDTEIINDSLHVLVNNEAINKVYSITNSGDFNNSFGTDGISRFILPKGYASLTGLKFNNSELILGSSANYNEFGIPIYTKIDINFEIDESYSSQYQLNSYDVGSWVGNDFLTDPNSCVYIVGNQKADGHDYLKPFFNKLDEAGNLDTSVHLVSNFSGRAIFEQLRIFDEHNFLVAGGIKPPSQVMIPMLTKMSNQGIIDSSFGINGIAPVFNNRHVVTNKIHPIVNSLKSIFILRFDKISKLYELLKLTSNGFVDSTFGQNGVIELSGDYSQIYNLNLTSGILDIVGKTSDEDILITKLEETGHPVANFGDSGVKKVEVQALSLENGIKSESGFFYVGNYSTPELSGLVIKLDVNGDIDHEFANSGYYDLLINETSQNEKKIQLLESQEYLYVARETANPAGKIEVIKIDINSLTGVRANSLGKNIDFLLMQNYPNPFNPATTIEFSLPELANVKLEVFNILGERVVELVNTQMKAGNHKVNFDASKIASGVYMYSLKAGDINLTKKMVVLK